VLQAVFSIDWSDFVGLSVFGKGRARICAVVATPRAREFRVLVRRALRETPTVELRLDWLANDEERHAALNWIKKISGRGTQFIATCRRRVGGGEFVGSAEEEFFWLAKAREAGCTWCDLEIETLKESRGKLTLGPRLPAKVMLSIHDFRRTPDLAALPKMAKNREFAAVKMAAMSRKFSDATRLLRAARGLQNFVAMPMGELGLPARILALREGGALVYAPVAAATAPGQVSLVDMVELYRGHELTRNSAVYGVIGNPIGHSLSPLLHNTGYVAAKRDAVYLPFLVGELGEFLRVLPDFGVRGFSVTIPHKEKILLHLDECEPLAAQIGAVNTVTVMRGEKLVGSNTDYLGVLRALEGKMRLREARVVVLGAGGSARAAAFAVAQGGAEVLICARRENAARELARAVGGGVLRRTGLRKEKFDALVNATPVGMHPHAGTSPLQAGELNCSLVMDLIYRPLETKLLRMARARGITTVSGADMFLAQGIAQWELWTGTKAPAAAMRKAVLGALREG
jgi:3-dehydroquinate dehydratase / shikimate dehydrogenase